MHVGIIIKMVRVRSHNVQRAYDVLTYSKNVVIPHTYHMPTLNSSLTFFFLRKRNVKFSKREHFTDQKHLPVTLKLNIKKRERHDSRCSVFLLPLISPIFLHRCVTRNRLHCAGKRRRPTSFYCTPFCVSRVLWFLPIEGATLHQHKDGDSLYPGVGDRAAVSEVGLWLPIWPPHNFLKAKQHFSGVERAEAAL